MNAEIDISHVRLETERLTLRAFCQADLADFYAYASVPGVGEWAGWPHHETIETSQAILDLFISEKKVLALVLKDSGRVIGSLGLEKIRCPLPATYQTELGRELGYVLAQDQWGQGLMSEAVSRVMDYLYKDLKLDFLVVGHFLRNYRSERVIEKAGFTYVGTYDFPGEEASRYYLKDNPDKK